MQIYEVWNFVPASDAHRSRGLMSSGGGGVKKAIFFITFFLNDPYCKCFYLRTTDLKLLTSFPCN